MCIFSERDFCLFSPCFPWYVSFLFLLGLFGPGVFCDFLVTDTLSRNLSRDQNSTTSTLWLAKAHYTRSHIAALLRSASVGTHRLQPHPQKSGAAYTQPTFLYRTTNMHYKFQQGHRRASAALLSGHVWREPNTWGGINNLHFSDSITGPLWNSVFICLFQGYIFPWDHHHHHHHNLAFAAPCLRQAAT